MNFSSGELVSIQRWVSMYIAFDPRLYQAPIPQTNWILPTENKLSDGTLAVVIDSIEMQNQTWVHVTVDNKCGWISSNYLHTAS